MVDRCVSVAKESVKDFHFKGISHSIVGSPINCCLNQMLLAISNVIIKPFFLTSMGTTLLASTSV